VDIMSADKQNVLLIPSTAVVYAPYGDSVFVLESSQQGGKSPLVAQPRFVRLGERRGDLVEVISGLKDGETVVANGAFKLRKGVAVMVNNALAPTVELNPKPTDR
jgi:membrane fusion protein, multidrug efflux system